MYICTQRKLNISESEILYLRFVTYFSHFIFIRILYDVAA